MKHINLITKFNQFINENHIDDLVLSEVIDNEIRVYVSTIRNLCQGVGEGIYNIDFSSENINGRYTSETDEYQNEITITFIDNAHGHISIKEWNKLSKSFERYEGKNHLDSFYINPNNNTLTLTFDVVYSMGLY